MSELSPIPEGFRSVTPYLFVPSSAEAIEFYGKAFGATERFRMASPDGAVMHAEILIGNSIVMMTDECEQFGLKSPRTVGACTGSTHLYVEDVDAAFAQATDAGCETLAPPTDMFWGDRFCKVSDPFGHHWSIATRVEIVSPEEMAKRHQAFMEQMQQGGPGPEPCE